ncbi:MAG: GAF domain-containing protein [Brevinema sp.]
MENNHYESYIKTLKQIHYLFVSMQNSHSMRDMLDITLKECISITRATYGVIIFKHPLSDQLYCYTAQNIPHEIIQTIRLNINEGISGTTIKNGLPKIINNIDLDPKYISIIPDTKSELSMPIKINDSTIGAIVLDNFEKNNFTEKDLEFVQMISSYASFAVKHFITDYLQKKFHKLLDTLCSIRFLQNPDDIFQKLATAMNVRGCCILTNKGEQLFSYGTLVDDIDLSKDLFEKNRTFILNTSNKKNIPYTRLTIPRSQKDMVFIADKTYYFCDTIDMDMIFCDNILELLASKEPTIAKYETCSTQILKWIEQTVASQDKNLYDLVIGDIEKKLIQCTLERNKNNKLRTSQILGINRNTLRHKMELYHLE